MPMTREQAYNLVDAERAAQDRVWADRTQYNRSAPHILILSRQLRKLEDDWYDSSHDALIERFVKMAAIAVRALEEIDPEASGEPYVQAATNQGK